MPKSDDSSSAGENDGGAEIERGRQLETAATLGESEAPWGHDNNGSADAVYDGAPTTCSLSMSVVT